MILSAKNNILDSSGYVRFLGHKRGFQITKWLYVHQSGLKRQKNQPEICTFWSGGDSTAVIIRSKLLFIRTSLNDLTKVFRTQG